MTSLATLNSISGRSADCIGAAFDFPSSFFELFLDGYLLDKNWSSAPLKQA